MMEPYRNTASLSLLPFHQNVRSLLAQQNGFNAIPAPNNCFLLARHDDDSIRHWVSASREIWATEELRPGAATASRELQRTRQLPRRTRCRCPSSDFTAKHISRQFLSTCDEIALLANGSPMAACGETASAETAAIELAVAAGNARLNKTRLQSGISPNTRLEGGTRSRARWSSPLPP